MHFQQWPTTLQLRHSDEQNINPNAPLKSLKIIFLIQQYCMTRVVVTRVLVHANIGSHANDWWVCSSSNPATNDWLPAPVDHVLFMQRIEQAKNRIEWMQGGIRVGQIYQICVVFKITQRYYATRVRISRSAYILNECLEGLNNNLRAHRIIPVIIIY
jgi:hypothetical protein